MIKTKDFTFYDAKELRSYIKKYDNNISSNEDYDYDLTKFAYNNIPKFTGQCSTSKVPVDEDFYHLMLIKDEIGRFAFVVNEYGYDGADGEDRCLQTKIIGGLKIRKDYLNKNYVAYKNLKQKYNNLEKEALNADNYTFDISSYFSNLKNYISEYRNFCKKPEFSKYKDSFGILFTFIPKKESNVSFKLNVKVSYYNSFFNVEFIPGKPDYRKAYEWENFKIRYKHTKTNDPYKGDFSYNNFNDVIKKIVNTIIDNNSDIDYIDPTFEINWDKVEKAIVPDCFDRNTAYFAPVDELGLDDYPEIKNLLNDLAAKDDKGLKEFAFDIVVDENRYNKHTIKHEKTYIMAKTQEEATKIFNEDWLPHNRGHVNYAFGTGLGSLVYTPEEWRQKEIKKAQQEKARLEQKLKELGV